MKIFKNFPRDQENFDHIEIFLNKNFSELIWSYQKKSRWPYRLFNLKSSSSSKLIKISNYIIWQNFESKVDTTIRLTRSEISWNIIKYFQPNLFYSDWYIFVLVRKRFLKNFLIYSIYISFLLFWLDYKQQYKWTRQ